MALINYVLGIIHRDEEGQGLAEYALILALIAIVAIVALIFLGGQVSTDPLDGRQLGLATVLSPQARSRALGARLRRFRRRGGARPHQRSSCGT